MEEAETQARDEAVVRAVLTHLHALVDDNDATAAAFAQSSPAAAFASEYRVGEAREAALPAPLRDALRDCASRGAAAATVARLAVLSCAARQLAAATLAPPARAARAAKAAAMRDVATAALIFGVQDDVQAAVVRLCSAEAQVPALQYAPQSAGDAIAAWRALAAATHDVATHEPSVADQLAYIGAARAALMPGEPLNRDAARRLWVAWRFATALAGEDYR